MVNVSGPFGASAGPTCTAMSASASAGLSLRFIFCCSNVEVIVVVEKLCYDIVLSY
jgi:hypothetical protein